jgi:hypothetical protein
MECGVMAKKQDVIDTNAANPDWNSAEIALHLGCSSGYVRETARRCGLTLGAAQGRRVRPPKVFDRRGLPCPSCGGQCGDVIDSRPTDVPGFQTIRRRRLCLACNARITTFEVPGSWVDDAKNYRNDVTARIESAATLGLITPEIRKMLEGK